MSRCGQSSRDEMEVNPCHLSDQLLIYEILEKVAFAPRDQAAVAKPEPEPSLRAKTTSRQSPA